MLNQITEFARQTRVTENALIIMIGVVIAFCLLFFFLAIVRRLYNGHKYRILDNLKGRQRRSLKKYLRIDPSMKQFPGRTRLHAGSMKWLALEHNLFALVDQEATREIACRLFEQLGYVDHYVKVLDSRKTIARASAIAKLGRMGSPRSAEALLAMLDTGNHEIIAVAVRSLAKVGNAAILLRLMEKLPDLLKENLVTKKTIDSSLVAAGPRIALVLLEYGKTHSDPAMIASTLGVLNAFPVNRKTCDFAVSFLDHPDPEVRARALRLIASCEDVIEVFHEEALPPLLRDPVWFVRLQAVRTIGTRRRAAYTLAISSLVLDEKWQVRNAAARALTLLGKGAIDAFWSLLQSNDRYAKESICEEMEKTGFVDLLMDVQAQTDEAVAAKAREILEIMVSCGFSSSVKDLSRSTPGAGAKRTETEAYNVEFIGAAAP
jgi:HEAT repeat protein